MDACLNCAQALLAAKNKMPERATVLDMFLIFMIFVVFLFVPYDKFIVVNLVYE